MRCAARQWPPRVAADMECRYEIRHVASGRAGRRRRHVQSGVVDDVLCRGTFAEIMNNHHDSAS